MNLARIELDNAKENLFRVLRIEPVDGETFADAQARCRRAEAAYWATLRKTGMSSATTATSETPIARLG